MENETEQKPCPRLYVYNKELPTYIQVTYWFKADVESIDKPQATRTIQGLGKCEGLK